MKVLQNSLKLEIDTWDDPGDYPSNAGSGPLPSYDFVVCVDGQLLIELEPEDLSDMIDFDAEYTVKGLQDYLNSNPAMLDPGLAELTVKRWEVLSLADNLAQVKVPEDDSAYSASTPVECFDETDYFEPDDEDD
jgi:hypothetical protein